MTFVCYSVDSSGDFSNISVFEEIMELGSEGMRGSEWRTCCAYFFVQICVVNISIRKQFKYSSAENITLHISIQLWSPPALVMAIRADDHTKRPHEILF